MLFVVTNLLLNVALIYVYGWIGAAVATALSVAISLVVAHRYLTSIIDFEVPHAEIVRQWLAAITMGVVVYSGLYLESTYSLLGQNAATVVLLVGLGAATYLLLLLAISTQFRQTVDRNLPVGIPLLSR